MAAFLSSARYELSVTPDTAGSRHRHRPRRVQTAEGTITQPEGTKPDIATGQARPGTACHRSSRSLSAVA